MPLFGEIEPAQIGQATRFDHPLNEWLGVKMGSGQAAQLGPRLFNFIGEAGDTSKKLTAKEANDQFGVPGHVKFDSDVSTDRATTVRDRKLEELKYAAYFQTASHSWLSGKALLGFGAEMLGANTHPVDLAINFLPFVGSEIKAARLAESGAGAFRVALARGLVTEESIALSRLPLVARFPNFSASTIDATLGNAALEIPNFYLARRDQTDYSADDLLTNVFAGGLAGGAFGAGIKQLMKLAHVGYEKLQGPTRENMFKEGIGNHLSSDPRNIGDNASLDAADIMRGVRMPETVSRDVLRGGVDALGVVEKAILNTEAAGADAAGLISLKTDLEALINENKAGSPVVPNAFGVPELRVENTVEKAIESRYGMDERVAAESIVGGAIKLADKLEAKRGGADFKSIEPVLNILRSVLPASGEDIIPNVFKSAEVEFQNRVERVLTSRLAQAERMAAGQMPDMRIRELQANIARASTVTKEQVDKFAKRVDPNDVVASHEADAAAKTEVAKEMEGTLNDYVGSLEKRAKELAESNPTESARLLAEAEAIMNDLKSELEMADLASVEDATINSMTNCITGI